MIKIDNNIYVSIILPCYNEKENIISLINEIHKKLHFCKHQIIVVDDNSPDGTYQKIIEQQFSYVKGILRTTDKGFAKSIRCGIENANGNILIIMDSDFNHQPKYLPFMINAIKYYDCVSASRFVYGGSMDNRLRHHLSWIFNIFVRLMIGGKITDSLYGYFAIRKKIIQKIDYDKIFWGYGDYCIRLFYYLQKKNTNILQFPAVNGKRKAGEGNSGFFKVFRQYFIEVLKLAFRIKIKKDV